MTDKTTLDDLLKLDLHKYEEEVKNIVDKAVKEMAMEKMLRELNKTWSELSFEKETHDRTKLNVLRINEEAIDTLEENQVCFPLYTNFRNLKNKNVIYLLLAGTTANHVGLEVHWIFPEGSVRLAAQAQHGGRRNKRLV